MLGRVQSFLPQLEDADRDLKERLQSHDPDDLDIENVAEGEACVEMVMNINVVYVARVCYVLYGMYPAAWSKCN